MEQAHGKWPWIDAETFKEWKGSPEETKIWESSDYVKYPIKCSTYLKAFYGAPCWTVQEMDHVTKAMTAMGWKFVKKSVPTKKHLISNSADLGLPWEFK